MASVFDLTASFNNKHGVAESTLLGATFAGMHFYNVMNPSADMDNGSVTAIDITKWKEGDYFEVKAPAVTDKIALVLNPPKIYEEYATQMQEEHYYYVGAGEIARAYEIFDTDRFTLSEEAFKDSPTVEPAVGKYVVVDGTGFKLDVVDSAALTTYGFVGYIYALANKPGYYRIFVIQNKTITA